MIQRPGFGIRIYLCGKKSMKGEVNAEPLKSCTTGTTVLWEPEGNLKKILEDSEKSVIDTDC